MKQPLLIITGPTAVGKTSLSISLAHALHGEIISADSMQVYRGMDVGTAKITEAEMDGIPHHLIDILDPSEAFNVFLFQKLAKQAIQDIRSKNHLPIIVGGTGFYIQALLYDIDFQKQETSKELRITLEQFAKEHGAQALHQKLRKVDPPSADRIHPNNIKRVIRAIEYYQETGEPISKHNEEQHQKESPYQFLYIVLDDKREKLYERIDKRVDLMVEQGLVSEMNTLIDKGYTKDLVSMQGIGYKELFPFFEGTKSLEKAIEQIKLDTRHFAKRQLTWFRREQDVTWLSKENYPTTDELQTKILSLLEEKMTLE